MTFFWQYIMLYLQMDYLLQIHHCLLLQTMIIILVAPTINIFKLLQKNKGWKWNKKCKKLIIKHWKTLPNNFGYWTGLAFFKKKLHTIFLAWWYKPTYHSVGCFCIWSLSNSLQFSLIILKYILDKFWLVSYIWLLYINIIFACYCFNCHCKFVYLYCLWL